MSAEQDDKLDQIYGMVEKIHRGMYGDQDNKTPGLIDRQIKDEERITALEKSGDKKTWWMSGFAAAISFVVSIVAWVVKEIWGR